jgi:hypothetical protein
VWYIVVLHMIIGGQKDVVAASSYCKGKGTSASSVLIITPQNSCILMKLPRYRRYCTTKSLPN